MKKNITDNKKIWKTVKPFFSDKTSFNAKITSVDKDKIITRDNETADVLNTFFSK